MAETAAAPVLVTGRVLSVSRNERVSEDKLAWKAETWSMTADIEVLRWYSRSESQPVPGRLQVHFLAYGPSVTMFVNGYPPPLPDIRPDRTLLLPLRENSNAGLNAWELMADSGVNLVIPLRSEMPGEPIPTSSGRVFLMREIANTLARGTPREMADLAIYFSQQREDLTHELMPLVESAVGEDRLQWAAIAANLHAAQGTPRPSVAELLTGKDENGRGSLQLAQAALRKLAASADANSLLIGTWIAMAPYNAWGAANSLVEFAEDPLTTDELRKISREDVEGSSQIALALANRGNKAILPDAIARAFRVADRAFTADSDYSELQSAASLIWKYGSDRDLTQLAGIVLRNQISDPRHYELLWQSSAGAGDRREERILAIVLLDRRAFAGDLRYCDVALSQLERATGQHFVDRDAAIQQRDAGITRALEWLRTQGIKN